MVYFCSLFSGPRPALVCCAACAKERQQCKMRKVPLTRYQTISRNLPSVLKLHLSVTVSPTITGARGSIVTVKYPAEHRKTSLLPKKNTRLPVASCQCLGSRFSDFTATVGETLWSYKPRELARRAIKHHEMLKL